MATPKTQVATAASSSAVTSTAPAGIAVGDAAWVVVSHSSASATHTLNTPASGWTKKQETTTAADFTSALWERDGGWQSGDSAPTFTMSTNVNWRTDFISIDSVDVATATVTNQAVAAGTNSLACAVTPTGDDWYLFYHGQVDATGAARTWTGSAGTEFIESTQNELHVGAYWRQLSGGSGVSQSTTGTVSGSTQDLAAFAWAIAPAAASSSPRTLRQRPRILVPHLVRYAR